MSIEVSTHALLKLFKANFISANFLISLNERNLKIYTTHVINYSQYCTSEHVISIECDQEDINQVREPNIAKPTINLMINRIEKLQKFIQGLSLLQGLSVITVTSNSRGLFQITAHTESCPFINFTIEFKVISNDPQSNQNNNENSIDDISNNPSNDSINDDHSNQNEIQNENDETCHVLLPLKTFGRLLDLANECAANGAHILLSISKEKYILLSIAMTLESDQSLVLNLLIPARLES